MLSTKHLINLLKTEDWDQITSQLCDRCVEVPIPRSQWNTWKVPDTYAGEITMIGHGATRRILLATTTDGLSRAVRQVGAAHLGTEILWVVRDHNRATFVAWHAGSDQTRRISIDLKDPQGVAVARLAVLAQGDKHAFQRAFDSSEVTQQFFRDFRSVFDHFSRQIRGGPDQESLRRELALTWLLRLVFLYFLQEKGALDQNLRFIANRIDGKDLHKNLWKPLFFGVLNTPSKDRDSRCAKLGTIAYLNGGLFEPTPLELDHPDADLPDDVWRASVLHTFERYYFVVREPELGDEVCAVDPEMLGKVFESLMAQRDRKKSGAFYTPRTVVKGIVVSAISDQLADVTGLTSEQIRLADLGDDRDALEAALGTLRVLDPAVGTGAFLMAALDFLIDVRVRSGLSVNGEAIQKIIGENLYGVDVNPTAIRICELRFWLRILVSNTGPISDLPPLPNLSNRFVPGDSLTDPLQGVVPKSRRYTAYVRKVRRLQKGLFRSHGKEKQEALRKLNEARLKMQLELVSSAEKKVRGELRIFRELENQTDLFGSAVVLTANQNAENEALKNESNALAVQRKDLTAGKIAPDFSYFSFFPDVMQRGGFDVVVMNPPWVRAHDISPAKRAYFRKRYRSSRPQLWRRAKSQGIRMAFGGQIELANVFVERALELARPGGRVAALIPAKVFRSLQGSSTRGLLAEQTIESIEDYGVDAESMFDATTYPASFQVKREANTTAGLAPKLLFGDDPKAPWCLGDSEVAEILCRVAEQHPALGEFDSLKPRRGFFTGKNDVFIRPQGEFLAKFGIREFVTPVKLGREGAYEVLLPYNTHAQIQYDVPKTISNYFEQYRDELEARSEFDPRLPLWQVFRMHSDHFGDKVLWRDMSVTLELQRVPGEIVPLNTTYYIAGKNASFSSRLVRVLRSPLPQVFARLLCERARGGWRRHFAWSVQCIPIPRVFFDCRSARPRSETIRRWYGLTEREQKLLEENLLVSV